MTVTRGSIDALVITVMCAIATGAGMHYLGNRTVRSWMLPLVCAILYGGVGHALKLPNWLVILGFLATPLVFHRNLRSRLRSAARGCARVETGGGESALVERQPDNPKALGAWTLEPEGDLDAELVFEGAEDEEYRVILTARAARAPKGILSCHTLDSKLGPDPVLKEREALSGLPGQTADMVVRALPEDYGFILLDIRTLAALGDILGLRTKTRDIHVHISGPRMRVESTETFDAGELKLLLGAAGSVFKKVRDAGAIEDL